MCLEGEFLVESNLVATTVMSAHGEVSVWPWVQRFLDGQNMQVSGSLQAKKCRTASSSS